MAPPADLRAWIALLEREGELVRIGAEVDPELEITQINDRTRVIRGLQLSATWTFGRPSKKDDEGIDLNPNGQ